MTGVGVLLRHYLRRDRWMLLWWTLGITLLYYSQAVSVRGLYATQAEFDAAAAAMESNAAFIAMAGPPRALNTIGGQVTWQASAFGAVCAGLLAMFLVGRHTRGAEESGRDELVRAGAVDRSATTIATVAEVIGAQLVVGAAVAVSLIAFPLAVADSLALGVGLVGCGLAFGAVALLSAQLAGTTRAAYGATGAAIAAAYALRALGDVGNGAASWFSPIGWYQAMHPFSGLRWWPILLLLGAAVGIGALALAVFGRRDYGAGLWPARPGPAHADVGLRGGLGLAWRQQRSALLGWTLGLFVTGLAYGSMGRDVGTLVGDSEWGRDIFIGSADDLVDGFFASALVMIALLASGWAVSSALRPRTEEFDGRLDALLAAGLSRGAWLRGYVLCTAAGTVVVMAAAGLGLGVGDALVGGGRGMFGFVAAALAWTLPVLVLAGATRLLVGVAPRWASLAWLGTAFGFVVLLFGTSLRIPNWIQAVSPFHYPALVPAQPWAVRPLIGLAVVAIALSLAGQAAFRRRDLA